MFYIFRFTETHNKKEFSNKLLQICNENKYNFKLKKVRLKLSLVVVIKYPFDL